MTTTDTSIPSAAPSVRPRIADGVELRELPSENGLALYRLSRRNGSGGGATLPAPLVAVVMLFDGEHDFADIDRIIRSWGMQPPREDFVAFLAHQLSQGALVLLQNRRGQAIEAHRFECVMCGQSCRGAEIGPLAPRRVEILDAQWRELVARGELPDGPHPVRTDAHGNSYLTRPDGACTFLADDQRCLIHAHFGLEAKPLACQLFPVVAVAVGDEVRLGISGACVQQHKSFEGGELLDLEGLFARMEAEGVRALPRNYARPDGGDREAALVQWLLLRQEVEPVDILALWARDLALPSHDAIAVPSAATTAELIAVTRAWGRSIQERTSLGTLPDAIPDSTPRRALAVELAQALVHDADCRLDALPTTWRSFLGYRLRGHLWLRVGYRHGSLADALLLFGIGAVVAVRFARRPALEGVDDETRFDAFAQGLTLWFLAIGRQRDADAVIGPAARRRLREALRGVEASVS